MTNTDSGLDNEQLARPRELANRLLDASSDRRALAAVYESYVHRVLTGPVWSEGEHNALRFPWRVAKEVSTNPTLAEGFRSPGLYLFGSDAGVPLYLGKTAKQTLWKRLRGRYLGGKRSQCQLASDYEQELLANGIDGFPDEIWDRYRRNFGSSTVRLKGAAAFAEHGIEGIWFTILPIEESNSVSQLEESLIPVADAWNQARGYPPLLNFHYTAK